MSPRIPPLSGACGRGVLPEAFETVATVDTTGRTHRGTGDRLGDTGDPGADLSPELAQRIVQDASDGVSGGVVTEVLENAGGAVEVIEGGALQGRALELVELVDLGHLADDSFKLSFCDFSFSVSLFGFVSIGRGGCGGPWSRRSRALPP